MKPFIKLAALSLLLLAALWRPVSSQSIGGTSVLGTGSVTQGTYASLPGSCTTGALYFFTDSVFAPARCSATNVWSLFAEGRNVTAPGLVASWTAVNAGSDLTATDDSGAIAIQIARNATLNWRVYAKAQPTPPYVLTFKLYVQGFYHNSLLGGVYFYDGTKLMGIEWLTQAGPLSTLRVEKVTNVTTDGSTAATAASGFIQYNNANGSISSAPPFYLQLGNNGTTLTLKWSLDGRTWNTGFSEAVGTYITPTHYAIGGVNVSATTTDIFYINVPWIYVQ